MVAVWWHCLIKLLGLNLEEPHQMCSSKTADERTKHFCSCGYKNNGKTWNELKEEMDKKFEVSSNLP